MKRILLSLLAIITVSAAFIACANNSTTNNKIAPKNASSDTANFTTIHWIDSVKEFGIVKFGKKVDVNYTFENSGTKPLYITEVRPTCGCTVADYTKGAVLPGQKGTVNAEFDSNHGVPGNIRKSIVVSSNTTNDSHFVLAFTGTVTK